MKKTHKKIENNLSKALTKACEGIKDEVEGLNWLTHTVNYDAVERTLMISCYFESADVIDQLLTSKQDNKIRAVIKNALASINITSFNEAKQIIYLVDNQ